MLLNGRLHHLQDAVNKEMVCEGLLRWNGDSEPGLRCISHARMLNWQCGDHVPCVGVRHRFYGPLRGKNAGLLPAIAYSEFVDRAMRFLLQQNMARSVGCLMRRIGFCA